MALGILHAFKESFYRTSIYHVHGFIVFGLFDKLGVFNVFNVLVDFGTFELFVVLESSSIYILCVHSAMLSKNAL